MRKKSVKKDFLSYIRWLNESNSNITKNNSIYPQIGQNIIDIYADEIKHLIYENVYNRLVNIMLKLYKWVTPHYISPRVIELGYIYRGAVVFFEDKNGLKLCLPAVASNIYNVYGDPTQVRAIGWNGKEWNIEVLYSEDVKKALKDYIDKIEINADGLGVFSRDNDTQYPYIFYIEEYANKISDKIMAHNIACQTLKKPLMFYGYKPEVKEDLNELAGKIYGNAPVILEVKKESEIVNENKNKPFEAVEIGGNPQNVKALQEAILFDFNMFLETIGINTNPSPDKTQVVLTPEIESNNNLIDIEQDVRYLNRVKFCKEIKEYFNIDIKIEKNTTELKKEIEKTKNVFLGKKDEQQS